MSVSASVAVSVSVANRDAGDSSNVAATPRAAVIPVHDVTIGPARTLDRRAGGSRTPAVTGGTAAARSGGALTAGGTGGTVVGCRRRAGVDATRAAQAAVTAGEAAAEGRADVALRETPPRRIQRLGGNGSTCAPDTASVVGPLATVGRTSVLRRVPRCLAPTWNCQ